MAQPSALDEDLPPSAVATIDSGTKSLASLEDLVAKATARYAVKDYSTAVEFYSRATELQAELNGEMSPRNADLLYLYGRCLYHLAVQSSDVLGARVASEDKSRAKSVKKNPSSPRKSSTNNVQLVEGANSESVGQNQNARVSDAQDKAESMEQSVNASGIDSTSAANTDMPSKPFFNITGDENWGDSSDESDAEEGAEDDYEGEAEDDFSNAFEVLDVARILTEKRLAELSNIHNRQEDEKNIAGLKKTLLETKKMKERLSDTRDLQAEISLEAERFNDAATDLEVALKIKKELFPYESSVIAEAHYKMSLALEFSSITPAMDDKGHPQPGTVGKVDKALREEAAKHMNLAIQSCKERISKEEALLSARVEGAESLKKQENEQHPKVTQQSVDDVKEMVADMEQRLRELKAPPLSIRKAVEPDELSSTDNLLGSIARGSQETEKGKLKEVISKANDLSGFVRRKLPVDSGKRKPESKEAEVQGAGKKAKK